MLAAGTKGQDKTIEEGRAKDGGIVPGHAYTILQVITIVVLIDCGSCACTSIVSFLERHFLFVWCMVYWYRSILPNSH